MFDDDYGYEMEAIQQERMDADLEMAQMTARANEAHRAAQRGICGHNSRVGANDGLYYPEQFILRPGEVMCTERTGGCLLIAPDDVVEDDDTGRSEWRYMVEWEPSKWDTDWAGNTVAVDRIAALPEPQRSLATRAILQNERVEGVAWFNGGWKG